MRGKSEVIQQKSLCYYSLNAYLIIVRFSFRTDKYRRNREKNSGNIAKLYLKIQIQQIAGQVDACANDIVNFNITAVSASNSELVQTQFIHNSIQFVCSGKL